MTTTEAYTKKITCPEHGDHEATLYQHGHKYAGIWECDVEGISDSCEHENKHVETVEPWPTSPTDTPREVQIYVCDDCDVEVEGDPQADMSFDCD